MQCAAFWFRRDLRLEDNAGLQAALNSGLPVIPVFIFDKTILDKLENPADARVVFIYNQVQQLKSQIQKHQSDLIILYGDVQTCWEQLIRKYEIQEVYTNRDYESYAIERDHKVQELFNKNHILFQSYKDQVIFEKHEMLKDDQTPYVVFTSFKNKFLQRLTEEAYDISDSHYLKEYHCKLNAFYQFNTDSDIALNDMGFKKSQLEFPKLEIDEELLKNYDKNRDYPERTGTSRLGVHLRFGTISIRRLFKIAAKNNQTFLSELIWRDFYSMILQAFPHVELRSFKPAYNGIEWINDVEQFKLWCEGLTGYPMVDAGMRELNATGYMHNRLRMITASFLVKHLLIDWRWGEHYFAEKLLDFELASNNGGWQWAAGCGTDAAPYFRIFNPSTQQQRFDPEFNYIRKWIPELDSLAYPQPIIEHKFARERCLSVFKQALKNE